jgi:hypothetical protein
LKWPFICLDQIIIAYPVPTKKGHQYENHRKNDNVSSNKQFFGLIAYNSPEHGFLPPYQLFIAVFSLCCQFLPGLKGMLV